jgi:hypothetical protein
MKKAIKQFIKGLGLFGGVVSLYVLGALIVAFLMGVFISAIVALFLAGWSLI